MDDYEEFDTGSTEASSWWPDEGGFDFSGFDLGSFDLGGALRTGLDLYRDYQSGGPSPSGFLPVSSPGPAPQMTDDGRMVPAAGGLAAATGMWLSTFLMRALGRGARAAIFTAGNGLRVRMAQLWPLVRQYGPNAVASALGITLGALGTLLTQAPTSSSKRRSRGISGRDVKITRRTIRQLKRMTKLAGIRAGGGGYRRPPRRRSAYYC